MTDLKRIEPEVWPILEYWEGVHNGCDCTIIVYHAGFETDSHCHKATTKLKHNVFGEIVKKSLVSAELRTHIAHGLWPKFLAMTAEDDMKLKINKMDHPDMSPQ